MYVVYVGKPPEFTETGEAVLGQCEPYTSGWVLKLSERGGPVEDLLQGTYYELRRVQRKCMGKSIDEIRRVCEDARAELGEKAAKSVFKRPVDTEESTHILDHKQVEKAVAEMEGEAAGGEADEEALWQKAEDRGCIILKPGGDAALDEMVSFGELSKEALRASKNVVIDLSAVGAASTQALEEFERTAKEFAEAGRHFSLAAPTDGVLSAIEVMRLDRSLDVKKTLDDTEST